MLHSRLAARVRVIHAFTVFTFLTFASFAATDKAAAPARQPWTASRVRGTPEPPPSFIVEHAFPKLTFTNALEAGFAPGGDRLFVVQQDGKYFSFPPDESVERADLFLDLKVANPEFRIAYGLAFHPRFAENRQVFVCYTVRDGLTNGSIVSRFTVPRADPPHADPKSEQQIIAFWSGGHNGGCLRFGPDGMLYISTGDGSGPNPPDSLDTGQDISDLLSSVLRIDVDHPDAGRAYRVPPDNPFVNTPHACPEIWAYGFRNPWKMSFDPNNGTLWLADVGWELWELVYRVQRGGNYGWSAMEGPQPVKPFGKRGPTPILPPTVAHSHHEAASITGGYVYRGAKFPSLRGAFIYGDWETGKIWALRHDGTNITSHALIADTPHRVVAFGEDRNGEQYYIHYATPSTLHRLVPNPDAGKSSNFPRKLSETGLFADTAKQKPAAGVYRFDVTSPLWTDGAKAERFIALPGTNTVSLEGSGTDAKPKFPTNAVLARTLTLELERGKPATARKIETQLLHFDGRQWRAYSYRWNERQSDATLVDAKGDEEVITVRDADAPGGKHTITWRFHSRAECLRCHNSWNGFVLGFQPTQLAACSDQLAWLASLALADKKFTNAAPKISLVNPHDDSQPAEPRVRSWLHGNCAHCHRIHGGGSVLIFLNHDATLAQTKLVDAAPLQGNFGIAGARIVAAGDPYRSVLLHRLSKSGSGHMPALGATQPDTAMLKVIHDWIASLPSHDEPPATEKAEAAALATLCASASTSADTERAIGQLTATVSGALRLLCAVDDGRVPEALRPLAIQRALKASDQQVRDLFDRFLPDDQRIEVLGARPLPEKILAKKGDRARGATLFATEGKLQCANCHLINGKGRDFGPDISKVATRLTRTQLLESILEPSKVIDPRFAGYSVELKNGEPQTGFIVSRTDAEISLKVATGETLRLPAANIAKLAPQQLSLMPEGLIANLTAQEAADLLAFLESLK